MTRTLQAETYKMFFGDCRMGYECGIFGPRTFVSIFSEVPNSELLPPHDQKVYYIMTVLELDRSLCQDFLRFTE